MALTAFDKAAISGAPFPFRVAVEIWAPRYGMGSPWYWCDINKPVAYPKIAGISGDIYYNRLLQFPTVKSKTEIRPSRFTASISDLILRDDDSAFAGEGWTLYHNATIPCHLSNWYHARVRVRIGHHVESTDTWTWESLGVFLIEDVKRSLTDKTARLELVGLERLLMDVKARDVRRGDTWLTNIPMPLLARELIERGGKGDIEISDYPNFPKSLEVTSTSEKFLSLHGNLPVKAPGTDTWNEKRDFVCRNTFAMDSPNNNRLYLLGYSITENKPQVLRWDRTTDSWLSIIFGDEGSEAVFGIHDEDHNGAYMFVCCISNKTAWPATYGHNPRNHYLKIYRLWRDLTSVSSNYDDIPVWMPNYCAHFPGMDNYSVWGKNITPSSLDKDSVTCPYDCMPAAPDYDTGAFEMRWISATDAATQKAPKKSDNHRMDWNAECDLYGFEYKNTKGYYGALSYMNTGTDGSHLGPMLTQAHSAAHDSFRYDRVRHKIYWLTWWHNSDWSTGRWFLNSFDISTLSYGAGQRLNFGGLYYEDWRYFAEMNITAFDLYAHTATTGYVWIAVVQHQVTGGIRDPASVALYQFSFGSGNLSGPSELAANFPAAHTAYSSGACYAPQIISIRHPRDESYLCGTVFNRYAASGHCYGFWFYDDGAHNGIYNNNDTQSFPVSTLPFELSTTGVYVSTFVRDYFAQDQATGHVWRVRCDGSAHTFVFSLIAGGDPVDTENTWASSNLFWDDWNSVLYGVSAADSPADCRCGLKTAVRWQNLGLDPELGINSPYGRISLWRWAYSLSDIIPVADFGDASVWDALEMIRQLAGDWIMGFDVDGKFYLKVRPSGEGITEIRRRGDDFIRPGVDIGCESIESALDCKNVINSITVPAWIGERSAPEAELRLTPKSTADTAATIEAQQISNASQRIVLTCMRSGVARSASGDYDGTTEPLIFSWSKAYADLMTSLKEAASQFDEFVLVYGLREAVDKYYIGDAEISIGDTLQVESANSNMIESLNAGTGRIELSGPVGGSTHSVGSLVTIIPKEARRYSDSAEGICELSLAFTPSPATVIRDMYVTDSSNLAPGVLIYRDTAYYKVISVVSQTHIRVLGKEIGSGRGQSVVMPIGTVLCGAIWFETSGRAYAIGGTGVSVAISARTNEAHNVGLFVPGDRIILTCSGLTSRKLENSIYHASDAVSIERYKKKEWRPRVENRLMTPPRARVFLEQAPDFAEPKWQTKAGGMPVLTTPVIGYPFTVRSSHLWPDDDTVGHIVVGITRNLDANTMALELRSAAPITRAAAAVAAGAPISRVKPKYDKYGRRRT